MTKQTCETIQDWIVEFADGELPERESTMVQEHLHDCQDCSAELSRLQLSLAHAQAIWQQKTIEVGQCDRRPVRTAGNQRALFTAIAAAVVLAVTISGALVIRRWRQPSQHDSEQNQTARVERQPSVVESGSELPEIETWIALESRAARLAASSELLAAQPSLANYLTNADEYLVTAFENSSAGEQAKQRLLDSNYSFNSGPQL